MSKRIQDLLRTLETVCSVDTRLIRPSQCQLRSALGNIDALAESIKQNGLLQPIVVRPKSDYFEVVAGNRRLAACKRLHLPSVLCTVKDLSDRQAYEASLVENVQRQTLDPIEEAQAFANYVNTYGYGSTSELARQIGKSEEYVSHRILLLTLPHEVLKAVSSRLLAPSSAEEIIWVKDPARQKELVTQITQSKLSAKRIRRVVKLMGQGLDISAAISSVSDSSADFERSNSRFSIEERDAKLIGEAALIFKSTLIHLDSLIERIDEQSELRNVMISKRYVVHQLLDDLIKMRNNQLRNSASQPEITYSTESDPEDSTAGENPLQLFYAVQS